MTALNKPIFCHLHGLEKVRRGRFLKYQVLGSQVLPLQKPLRCLVMSLVQKAGNLTALCSSEEGKSTSLCVYYFLNPPGCSDIK